MSCHLVAFPSIFDASLRNRTGVLCQWMFLKRKKLYVLFFSIRGFTISIICFTSLYYELWYWPNLLYILITFQPQNNRWTNLCLPLFRPGPVAPITASLPPRKVTEDEYAGWCQLNAGTHDVFVIIFPLLIPSDLHTQVMVPMIIVTDVTLFYRCLHKEHPALLLYHPTTIMVIASPLRLGSLVSACLPKVLPAPIVQ